jgi:hypothetical protein
MFFYESDLSSSIEHSYGTYDIDELIIEENLTVAKETFEDPFNRKGLQCFPSTHYSFPLTSSSDQFINFQMTKNNLTNENYSMGNEFEQMQIDDFLATPSC